MTHDELDLHAFRDVIGKETVATLESWELTEEENAYLLDVVAALRSIPDDSAEEHAASMSLASVVAQRLRVADSLAMRQYQVRDRHSMLGEAFHATKAADLEVMQRTSLYGPAGPPVQVSTRQAPSPTSNAWIQHAKALGVNFDAGIMPEFYSSTQKVWDSIVESKTEELLMLSDTIATARDLKRRYSDLQSSRETKKRGWSSRQRTKHASEQAWALTRDMWAAASSVATAAAAVHQRETVDQYNTSVDAEHIATAMWRSEASLLTVLRRCKAGHERAEDNASENYWAGTDSTSPFVEAYQQYLRSMLIYSAVASDKDGVALGCVGRTRAAIQGGLVLAEPGDFETIDELQSVLS